jgi:hypothetical protein
MSGLGLDLPILVASSSGTRGGGGFTTLSGDLGPFGANTRAFNINYTATKPTLIVAYFYFPATEIENVQGQVGPDVFSLIGVTLISPPLGTGNQDYSMTFFVPAGYVYNISNGFGSNAQLTRWMEAT